MKQYTTQKLFIDGPVGKLETILAEPEATPRGIAIIAHPHPLHGGTMDNKVVYTLFQSLLDIGFITVKFNFRGVGNSEGVFGNGQGEVEDVIAVATAICEQYHQLQPHASLLLVGFSFGGGVQLHAASQLRPESLLLVAPSVQNLDAPPVNEHAKHTLIIHGENDEIIPIKTILDWAEPQALPVVVIPGTTHFFHGKLLILKQIIHNFNFDLNL